MPEGTPGDVSRTIWLLWQSHVGGTKFSGWCDSVYSVNRMFR